MYASLLLLCLTGGQVQQPPDIVPTPAVSLGWVAEHQAQVPVTFRRNFRYVVAPPSAGKDWAGAFTVGLNIAINREGVIYKPTPLANGWALAIDFGQLVADKTKRAKVLAVWDSLALRDPYYHVPAVNSGLTVPVVASHLPEDQVTLVVVWSDQQRRHGVVPVFRADFAFAQMMAAQEGVFYELRLVQFKPNEKKWSPEDIWLAERGHFQARAAQLKSDRRKATFKGGPTGYPRAVVSLRGLVGRGWITEDVLGVDTTRHPMHSLLPNEQGRLAADAKEHIVEMPSGIHDFLLTDGTGRIQRKAVLKGRDVRDTTVPAPYPALLQPAISCIRCHWRGEFKVGDQSFPFNGLRPVPNDVQVILAPQSGVDIFSFKQEEVTRLAGLYGGGVAFDRNMQLGRAGLSLAVFQASGLTVQQAGDAVTELFNDYRYTDLTAERACLELGVRVQKEQSAEQVLASLVGNAFDNPDATLLALLRGLSVRREDWERIYHDVYLRTLQGAQQNEVDAKSSDPAND